MPGAALPAAQEQGGHSDLSAIETLGDASAAVSKVIASAAGGQLMPDEAGSAIALMQ